jgi:protein TonB
MSQGTPKSIALRAPLPRAALAAAVTALLFVGCQKEAEAPQPEAAATPPAAAPEAQVEAAPEAAPVAAIPEDMSIADMLGAARQALTDERVVTPAGNSAIEYYLAVLAKEPNNPTAAQALVDVYPMAVAVAEREIAARRLDEAERIVALLDRASPNSFSVRSLRERVVAARDADARAQLAQQQEQERQRQAAELARQQAAEAAPEPEPEPVAQAPVEPEPEPEPAPAPPPQPVVTAPPPPPAAPVGETRPARPLRQVQPGYPPDAARRRQEGWVELSFTIGVDGRVTDVQVVRAQPARVFDREAISAMQQWTFEPALRDGQPVSSRGARRMEFQL